jgi:hypothetical protein
MARLIGAWGSLPRNNPRSCAFLFARNVHPS